jgi:hypothetical protein
MSTKEIENKAKRLKLLKNRQESLQQEIDQLEADLKAQLEAWNVDEVQAGPFRVIWKMVNSTRFDSKRFKAVGHSRTISRDRLQDRDIGSLYIVQWKSVQGTKKAPRENSQGVIYSLHYPFSSSSSAGGFCSLL